MYSQQVLSNTLVSLLQVLSQQWVGRSRWTALSSPSKLVHTLTQLLLTPLLCLAFLTRAVLRGVLRGRGGGKVLEAMDSCYLFNSLDSPINRAISDFSSMMVIMALIIVAVFHPISRCHTENFAGIYPSRVALIVMIGACVFKEFEDFSSVRSFKIFFRFDFWRICRSINHWTIIIAIAVQIHLELRIFHNPKENFHQEAYLSDALFAIATTISVLHFLYWMQLHDTMGPIVISVSKVLKDVITISCMYLVVLSAFSCGIVFMGSDKIKAAECNLNLNVRQLQPIESRNSKILRNFRGTIETMFWSMLGPGQEFKQDDPQDLISSQVSGLYIFTCQPSPHVYLLFMFRVTFHFC